MATFISHSPAETEALGQAWGRTAQSGWVIGLSGDLGAGKTQLVKGLARGLDIPALVHSPTFALVGTAMLVTLAIASFLPALQATRVDPQTALRYE